MKLPILRPAMESDLPDLIRLSKNTAYGITSLPPIPSFLENKIQKSIQSFAQQPDENLHQAYLFFLEWNGRVVGTSGIVSHIGIEHPFYAYHVHYEKLECSSLNIDRDAAVLHLIQARKKPSETISLFLSKERGLKDMGKLLSLSRFLFVANFRSRFAETFVAEIRGVNRNGSSPFWEAVGKHFFNIDFSQAELLRTNQFHTIEKLFPKHPLYVDLLPPEAQMVIGIPHTQSIAAQKILEKQGFKKSPYIDIFDGGPHLFAPTDQIHVVKTSSVGLVRELRSPLESNCRALIANMRLQFRATLAPLIEEETGRLILHPDVARVLEIDVGDPVRYFLL